MGKIKYIIALCTVSQMHNGILMLRLDVCTVLLLRCILISVNIRNAKLPKKKRIQKKELPPTSFIILDLLYHLLAESIQCNTKVEVVTFWKSLLVLQ